MVQIEAEAVCEFAGCGETKKYKVSLPLGQTLAMASIAKPSDWKTGPKSEAFCPKHTGPGIR